MMNSNELMQDLYDSLVLSGWLDRATEFYQGHPEYFHECSSKSGIISGLSLSVSFQPDSLSDVPKTEPCVFISMGHPAVKLSRVLSIYDTGTKRSETVIDGMTVVDIHG